MYPNVVLVGPMGAGKSTIGKVLSNILKVPFYDSDRIIEQRSGADIPWIFDVEGEEGFRQRETAVLRELLQGPEGVIATGGGIVTRPENRDLLKGDVPVIYLTATLKQLVERTQKDKKRPLLQVENPEERIRHLFAERDPLYREVANVTVPTGRRGPKAIALQIVDYLTPQSVSSSS